MKVGDIVKIKYLPGSRDIVKNQNHTFIFLESTSYPFFVSELELTPEQKPGKQLMPAVMNRIPFLKQSLCLM